MNHKRKTSLKKSNKNKNNNNFGLLNSMNPNTRYDSITDYLEPDMVNEQQKDIYTGLKNEGFFSGALDSIGNTIYGILDVVKNNPSQIKDYPTDPETQKELESRIYSDEHKIVDDTLERIEKEQKIMDISRKLIEPEKVIRAPINISQESVMNVNTALVIIGPQYQYVSNKKDRLMINLTEILKKVPKRITAIYNILFESDINDKALFSDVNFLMHKMLADEIDTWNGINKNKAFMKSISLDRIQYLLTNDHSFQKSEKLTNMFKQLKQFDKVYVVSFLDSELYKFMNIFMKSMPSIKIFTKIPKIILLKDLDADLLDTLDSRVILQTITDAFKDDIWSSDIMKSHNRNYWTDIETSDKYADPEISESNMRDARRVINARAKLHKGPYFTFKEGLPINPFKNDYMVSGKGSLPYYGPNFCTYIFLTRHNNYNLLGKPIVEILLKKNENGEHLLIGYLDNIEVVLWHLKKVLGLPLISVKQNLIFEGAFVVNPLNTKNSWIEGAVYYYNLDNLMDVNKFRLQNLDYEWVSIEDLTNLVKFNNYLELLPVITTISGYKDQKIIEILDKVPEIEPIVPDVKPIIQPVVRPNNEYKNAKRVKYDEKVNVRLFPQEHKEPIGNNIISIKPIRPFEEKVITNIEKASLQSKFNKDDEIQPVTKTKNIPKYKILPDIIEHLKSLKPDRETVKVKPATIRKSQSYKKVSQNIKSNKSDKTYKVVNPSKSMKDYKIDQSFKSIKTVKKTKVPEKSVKSVNSIKKVKEVPDQNIYVRDKHKKNKHHGKFNKNRQPYNNNNNNNNNNPL